MEIQERIKQRREQLGMSIRELADRLNLSPSTVLRYETAAIRSMGVDKIETLARELKCTPEYLMGWTKGFANDIIEIYEKLDDVDQAKVYGYADGLYHSGKYNTHLMPMAAHALKPYDANDPEHASDDAIMNDDEEWK